MKYSKELKIGVFVVVVLIVSFFLINYLRGEDIMNREIEVESRYETVEGLVASAPVFIKGYKAGKVSEVVYLPETDDFKVVCSVRKEFVIPEESKMTIYSVDIMGGKGVKIDLGTSSIRVEDGAYLQPAFEAGLMDGLAAGLAPLLSKVGTTLDSLEVTVSGVNRLLSEQNTASISRTLSNLEKTIADVRILAASVGDKSGEIDTFINNLTELSEIFNGIAHKADSTVSGVNTLISTLNESEIEEAVKSFHELLNNVNDPDGSVGKLMRDDSVYNSVDSLLFDIDQLVRKIQENPKKYLKISVF